MPQSAEYLIVLWEAAAEAPDLLDPSLAAAEHLKEEASEEIILAASAPPVMAVEAAVQVTVLSAVRHLAATAEMEQLLSNGIQ